MGSSSMGIPPNQDYFIVEISVGLSSKLLVVTSGPLILGVTLCTPKVT